MSTTAEERRIAKEAGLQACKHCSDPPTLIYHIGDCPFRKNECPVCGAKWVDFPEGTEGTITITDVGNGKGQTL